MHAMILIWFFWNWPVLQVAFGMESSQVEKAHMVALPSEDCQMMHTQEDFVFVKNQL